MDQPPSDKDQIVFMKWKIRMEAQSLALKSVVGMLYEQVVKDDKYLEVFDRLFTHYEADRLSALQEKDVELFQKVDDLDWDSYNPFDLRPPSN